MHTLSVISVTVECRELYAVPISHPLNDGLVVGLFVGIGVGVGVGKPLSIEMRMVAIYSK